MERGNSVLLSAVDFDSFIFQALTVNFLGSVPGKSVLLSAVGFDSFIFQALTVNFLGSVPGKLLWAVAEDVSL
jgi:hypothetical protein